MVGLSKMGLEEAATHRDISAFAAATVLVMEKDGRESKAESGVESGISHKCCNRLTGNKGFRARAFNLYLLGRGHPWAIIFRNKKDLFLRPNI